ncbi:hypothetical protein HDU87_008526 [Geranomyces variabilis]|uniref:AB hydrolase-1 domain-containing protein n=1 Tax=Geranomyces variabilis TaxID=109894 RepID=A0AAD5TNT0_9FUNG|nr:hypothetical protein HDU87_008526 [Geranomyces variabilis]
MTIDDPLSAASRTNDEAALFNSPRARQFLKLPSGLRVAYAEVGDPTGVPVFMLTGLSGVRLYALFFAEVCLEAGVRLIAFDEPGVGLSGELKDGDGVADASAKVLFKDVVEITLAIADHLEIPRFGLLGFSLGTVSSLTLAKDHAARIIGPIQLFSPYLIPNSPGISSLVKVGAMLNASLIRSVVSAALGMGCDPHHSVWRRPIVSIITEMGGFTKALGATSSACFPSSNKSDDEDEDDSSVEEEKTTRLPLIVAMNLRLEKLEAISYALSRDPALTAAAAEEKVRKLCPKAAWRDTDVSAELNVESGFPRRPYAGQGMIRDLLIGLGKFGGPAYKPEDVLAPCHIWHGTADGLVPLAAVRTLAKALPHATLTEVRKGSHVLIRNRKVAILAFGEIVDAYRVGQ